MFLHVILFFLVDCTRHCPAGEGFDLLAWPKTWLLTYLQVISICNVQLRGWFKRGHWVIWILGLHLFSEPRPLLFSVCSVVCEIGPAKRNPPQDLPFERTNSGPVEITVEGERSGTSQVYFTYRVRQDLPLTHGQETHESSRCSSALSK